MKLGPEECRLWDALDRLKTEMKLATTLGDMATEIMRVASNVTSLWDNNAWTDTERHGDLLLPYQGNKTRASGPRSFGVPATSASASQIHLECAEKSTRAGP